MSEVEVKPSGASITIKDHLMHRGEMLARELIRSVEAGDDAHLEFGLLGPLCVRLDGVELAIASPKLRIVLAIMLLRAGRPVSIAELADATWGQEQPENPRRAVQLNVTRLRSLLGRAGSLIITGPEGYRFDALAADIDLVRFDRYCQDAEAAAQAGNDEAEARAWELGLRQWRAEPLADIISERLQREAVPLLKEKRLQALERYIGAQIRRGRYEETIGELFQLTSQHPVRERLWVLLMTALDKSGRRAEALEAYHAVRRHLADELGIDPSADLRGLHEAILTGRTSDLGDPVGMLPPIPRQLPPDIRGFTGRLEQLAMLDDLLDGHDGQGPMIGVIIGTAGVGKTTLAVRWARRVTEHFPDGQLWVNLRGFDPGQPLLPARVLTRFLQALGVPGERIPLELDQQVDLYRSLTDGRRLLIVLDNALDAEQVWPLIPGTPGCAVIITSRNQLAKLISGTAAHPLVLDLFLRHEAQQMLAQRLGPDRVQTPAVDELIDLCARLPLALAIVAAGAASHPDLGLDTLASQLREVSDGTMGLPGSMLAAEVRATFSWSYRALSPEAAHLFRLLGVHPGPDLAPAAAASLTGVPVSQTRTLLDELCQAHLLNEYGSDRYGFHDLLRAYAAELAQADETVVSRSAAMHRMFDHYLHTAYPAALLLGPQRDPIQTVEAVPGVVTDQLHDHRQAIAWFANEHMTLLAAIEMAASTEFFRYTWSLSATTGEFLSRRGHWCDWIVAQRRSLDLADEHSDLAEQARAHRALARAYYRTNQLAEAESHCKSALAVSEELGDQLGLGWTHQHLAVLRELQGRLGDALKHDLKALNLFKAGGDRQWEARSLNHIGWDYVHLGDYRQAIMYCAVALHMMRDLDDRVGQAGPYDSLGLAYHRLGEHAKAIKCCQQALVLYREFGARFNEAEVLTHLGDAQLAAGDRAAARTAWADAFAILSELQHRGATKVLDRLRALHAVRRGSRPDES